MSSEEKKSKPKYICKKCKFECVFKSNMGKHKQTELHKTGKRKKRSDCKEPYKCEECEYETKNKTTFKQHVLNEHADLKTRKKEFKYYCKHCDFGTFSIDIINNHNNSKKHKKYIKRSII